ncbi:helix-turn-helix domain-containing protein [Chryseobacterium sp.]|uniref:winged helix-turn-helix transcriptional regulator n=1 Tax=Chryseobacterium sp. TaxID=1871047 RepID=UPI0025B7D752|nr:helix-turn-helix domain-containing protein [Chryseobacterium sp.]
MRKEHSTNTLNEIHIHNSCSLQYAVDLISKRWSLIILCRLQKGKMRFNELYKSIDKITERMLSLRLKELENQKLIKKEIIYQVPLNTEYELTELGLKLSNTFNELRAFGEIHKKALKK